MQPSPIGLKCSIYIIYIPEFIADDVDERTNSSERFRMFEWNLRVFFSAAVGIRGDRAGKHYIRKGDG